MENIIEFDCECESCHGTGIFSGMGEGPGFGVVCHTCEGSGKAHRKIEYRDFEGRKALNDLHRVLETNPGIGLGLDKERGLTLESFGGMGYHEWLEGQPFPPKSEMRQFTCPAWWYQSANYSRKPDWDSCRPRGIFSSCDHFPHKEECWERFDKENS